VLITFSDPAPDLGPWGEHLDMMREELEALFGRRVDLVEKKLVNNPFRRHHILTHRGSSMRPEDRDAASLWDALQSATKMLTCPRSAHTLRCLTKDHVPKPQRRDG
jgi:hypothetical protein